MKSSSFALGFSLFVAAAGMGLAYPVIPGIVARAGGGGAAYGILISLAAFAQLLFSPLWGIAADRIGRKPVLAIGLGGCAASLVLFALARGIVQLAIARAATGVLAAAVLPAALAASADRSRDEDRAAGIGKLMASFSLGVIAGPALGGLLGEFSEALPLYIGAVLTCIALVLVLTIVPESLVKSGDTRSRKTPNLRDTIEGLPLLLGLILIASFGTACFQAVFGIDATRRFELGSGAIGALLAAIGAGAAIIQGLLAGPATRRLGEGPLARLSMLGGGVGFLALAAASHAFWYVAAALLYVLAHALMRPSLQSLAISRGDERGKGRALGLANAAQGLGAAIGPLAAGPLLDLSPRSPYLLGAGILLLSALASARILGKLPR